MGFIILAVLILVEVGFFIWNMKASIKHKKEKAVATFILTGLFLILSLTGVIQWSLRYYAVALLLIVQTIYGVVVLVREKNQGKQNQLGEQNNQQSDKQQIRKGRLVAALIGKILLCVMICIPAILLPQFKKIKPTGEYKVKEASFTYVDQNRVETYKEDGSKREVNVAFWYPDAADHTFPLVVFSHGSYGIKDSNTSLYKELASNGYVVCSIDHPYSSFFTKNQSGRITTMSSKFAEKLQNATTSEDKNVVYQAIHDMMTIKTGDINFVLDTIEEKAAHSDSEQVYKEADTSMIAVTGHSLGGSAALGVGRTRANVKAVVSLEAPYMCDIKGVHEQNGEQEYDWNQDPYPVPVLNIYSNSSWGRFGESDLYAQNQKELSDSESKTYNIHINGIGHLQLCDLGVLSPALVQMIDATSVKGADTRGALIKLNQATLQFLDYYMKGKGTLDLNTEM